MTLQWSVRYRAVSAPTYYRGGASAGAQQLPLDAFIFDHLNASRQTLILGLSNIRREAEANVRRRSRVDTGDMRRMVMSDYNFSGDRLHISFGWSAHTPYYAVFQEFGTRNGITPMLAVYQSFHNAIPQVQRLVRGR